MPSREAILQELQDSGVPWIGYARNRRKQLEMELDSLTELCRQTAPGSVEALERRKELVWLSETMTLWTQLSCVLEDDYPRTAGYF